MSKVGKPSNQRKLRIGVDISSLSAPMAGIGRYTKELLSRLTLSEHEWFLYSCAIPRNANFSGSSINWRVFQKPEWLPHALWFQTLLPKQLREDNLDIFWSPAHRLPIFMPKGIKQVVTIHDLVWRHAPQSMRIKGLLMDRMLMPHALRVCDRVISVSKSTSNDIAKEFSGLDLNVDIVGLGANDLLRCEDGGVLNVLGKYQISTPYFLFVGTLEPRKNLARLIEAFSLIPRDCFNRPSLVVVGGNGWGGVDPMELGIKFGISENLRVLDNVSDIDLAHLYKNCLCLALPSVYEGFGLPIIEAMTYGAPILTSNISSMPEVAGNAAILVNPLDVVSIADGLSRIMNSHVQTKLRREAITNSKRYSWDAAAISTLNIFESLFPQQNNR